MILRAKVRYEIMEVSPRRLSAYRAKELFYDSPLGKFVLSANLICDVERTGAMINDSSSRTIYTAEITIVDYDDGNEALLRLFHNGTTVTFFDLSGGD